MGNMDGVEAMKKIRADVKGLNREIPVVADEYVDSLFE